MEILEKHNDLHNEFKRLEASCKELFANYFEFREAVKSCPTFPSPTMIHQGPIFNIDYQDWMRSLQCPSWSGQSAQMQIIRDRCSLLLGELAEGRTILGEDEEAEGTSPDQPLLGELVCKEVDGVWAARAQLKFANSKPTLSILMPCTNTRYLALDRMILTPEEELQFYGFSEAHAHRILLEAEFDVDEDNAYEMALYRIEAIKEDMRFGWLGNSL